MSYMSNERRFRDYPSEFDRNYDQDYSPNTSNNGSRLGQRSNSGYRSTNTFNRSRQY